MRIFRERRKSPQSQSYQRFQRTRRCKVEKRVPPIFAKKQAHGTRCRRRSVNGTVSRNGSSQFSDAYSCDFKQLVLSNLCRKSCKNPFFYFLANRKKCPPIFSLNRKKCPPIFTKNCFKTVIHLLLCKLSKVLCYNGFIRFLRYLACARARARTHAKCFLLELLSISCIVRRNEMENLQCLFSFKKF